MKKKILKVLAMLAVADWLDIISKGQVIGWLKEYHNDAAEDLMDISYYGKNNPIRLRAKLINYFANLWCWFISRIFKI